MPVICIGPVCIPWACLPAIVYFIWKFARPLLPEKWALAIEEWGRKVRDMAMPYLEKVPGFKPKKKAKAAGATGAAAAEQVTAGEVGQLQSQEQLDALLARSQAEDFAVVLDFTASWCRPCQAIKPKFKALAAEHSKHIFLEVDADELDDVVGQCGVMGLPTFQVYRGSGQVGSLTGGDSEQKLVDLISQHLTSSNGSKKGD
eukprot:TRINITY_DN23762_c0_g1_i1.p1 TRINITY_DN23762_c0_g1~~TRINITY_DN23762_c0_g1_i1.p1  ORF type:complete len:202 (-),score=59.58 TRINITY_DN23762_c0_g1_i1:178-783(-)